MYDRGANVELETQDAPLLSGRFFCKKKGSRIGSRGFGFHDQK